MADGALFSRKKEKGGFSVAKKGLIDRKEANDAKDLSLKLRELREQFDHTDAGCLPTGLYSFDFVLGGGLPRGRVVELASDSGLGKSTSALHIAKNIASRGEKVVYLDFEAGATQDGKNSLIQSMGLQPLIDSEMLTFLNPITYTDLETVLVDVLGQVSVIFVDSVSAILASKLRDVDLESVSPGIQAQRLSAFFTKYKGEFLMSQTTMFFVNQLRVKINMRGGPSPMVAMGGNALKFFSDVRLRIEPNYKERVIVRDLKNWTENPKFSQTLVGARNYIYAIKNRNTKSGIYFPLTVIFGKGVSNLYFLVDAMMSFPDILKKKGGGYFEITLNGETTSVRGRQGLQEFCAENKEEVERFLIPKIEDLLDMEIRTSFDQVSVSEDIALAEGVELGDSFSDDSASDDDGQETGVSAFSQARS